MNRLSAAGTSFLFGTKTDSLNGEWHFAYILGGLGVQDVLFATGFAKQEYGTTLRTFDKTNNVWMGVWTQPERDQYAYLRAESTEKGIVHELLYLTDRREQWKFVEITKNSFEWRSEISKDGGATWYTNQTITGLKRQ